MNDESDHAGAGADADADVEESETTLEIEPAGMRSSGRCACCGKSRKTAWGYVYRDGGPRACYFVEWTPGRSECSARFDVVVGSWFDGTTEDDRETISLDYRVIESGPSFSLADADGRPAAEVGRPKKAAAVEGTALAEEVSAIASAVLEVDERLSELSSKAQATRRGSASAVQ